MLKLASSRLFRQQAYIDVAWAAAADGATLTVTNPADGSTLGTVPKMGAAETHRAIAAA